MACLCRKQILWKKNWIVGCFLGWVVRPFDRKPCLALLHFTGSRFLISTRVLDWVRFPLKDTINHICSFHLLIMSGVSGGTGVRRHPNVLRRKVESSGNVRVDSEFLVEKEALRLQVAEAQCMKSCRCRWRASDNVCIRHQKGEIFLLVWSNRKAGVTL